MHSQTQPDSGLAQIGLLSLCSNFIMVLIHTVSLSCVSQMLVVNGHL